MFPLTLSPSPSVLKSSWIIPGNYLVLIRGLLLIYGVFMNWIKKQVFEIFIKGYLADFVKRQKGYVFLISVILALIQVAIGIITSPDALYVLSMIASIFGDVAPFKLTPQDVAEASTAILAIWGLVNKFLKMAKGLPQVPTIIIEKEVLKESPKLEAEIKQVIKK